MPKNAKTVKLNIPKRAKDGSRRGNLANLKPPFGSPEEAREAGRKGGKRSAEVRRQRKSLAETLKAMLSAKVPKGTETYKKLKAQMREFGMDWEPTVQDIPTLGMLTKAAKNPLAFVAIRDTIGERPVEHIQDDTPPPPISLGFMPVVDPIDPDAALSAPQPQTEGDTEA